MRRSLHRTACRLALAAAAVWVSWTPLAAAMTGEVSFTPTGLQLSIMRIVLEKTDANGNPTAQAVLYTCPHETEEQCLVDVTDQNALDVVAAAAQEASIDVGTYDTVSLEMCRAGKPGGTPAPGFVRGSFTVESEGRTYATTSDPDSPLGLVEVAADDDASAGEFTPIGNWGCSTKRVHLPTPVEVTEAAPTDLTVVVDASLIAFSTPNVSGGMGGCRGQDNGQARGICVSYPSVVPLVGEQEPALDRFLLAHHRTDAAAIDDSRANAYVVVLSDGDGTLLTAFVRPYFSETSAQSSSQMSYDPVYGGPGYFGETLVSSVQASGGAISFVTGGSLDGNSAIFEGFTLDDHFGQVSTRTNGAWHYHALPILP